MLSYQSRSKLFAFPSPSLDSKNLGFQLPKFFVRPNFSDFLIFRRCLIIGNKSPFAVVATQKCVSWAIVIIFSSPEPKAHW